MKGPEIYLNELGIRLSCAVNPDKSAAIDSLHRVFVNWETYFTSDDAATKAFLSTPYEYTGLLTDPVDRSRFQPAADSPRIDYQGRVFFFASEANAQTFSKEPERYATPMIAMRRIEK